MYGSLTQVYQAPTGTNSRYDQVVRNEGGNTIPVIIAVDTRNIPNVNANGGALKSKFTVSLSSEFRDVVSIELVNAIIPHTIDINNNALPFPYLILNVNNLKKVAGNTNDLESSFCIIGSSVQENNNYIHKRRGSVPDDVYTYYYREPTRINKLDIQLSAPAGTSPNFVAGDHPVLVFEIRTLTQHRKLVC